MKLDEILKPSYEPQEITIRINREGNEPGAEERARKEMGNVFPIVRMGNQVFMFQDIKRFELRVGEEILPTMSVKIDCGRDRLKEELSVLLDKLTFFLGDNNDPHFIKLDMLILNSSAKMAKFGASFDCEMYVPNIYKTHIRSFDTLLDALKEICNECQIGLLMNYTLPELPEGVKIIQDGITNLEMIKRIAAFGSKDLGTCVTPFIDQVMYLNMLEVTSLYTDETVELIDICPWNGEALSSPRNQLILTNNTYNEDRPFNISDFVPSSEYATIAKVLPKKTQYSKTNLHNLENDDSVTVEHKLELLEEKKIQFNLPDEYATLYQNVAIAQRLRYRLDQYIKMYVRPIYFIPQIYCGMNIPLEIYNKIVPVWYNDQENPDKTIPVLEQEAKSVVPNYYEEQPNELLSGNYYVRSIRFIYTGEYRLRQELGLIAKMSEETLAERENKNFKTSWNN